MRDNKKDSKFQLEVLLDLANYSTNTGHNTTEHNNFQAIK